KSAISRALTQTAEPVRSVTSTTSAITAIHVPRPEIRVEPKRSRKLGEARSTSRWRAITGSTRRTLARRQAVPHAGERLCAERVFVRCSGRDPDGRVRTEPVQRPDDDPFGQE